MSSPRFPSKIDWWLALILVALPFFVLASLVGAIQAGEPLVGLFGPLLVAAIYVGVVFPTRYEVDDDALTIRFGMARKRVPYRQIRGVTPTRNPLSSPALSLDRLRIEHGRWGTMISPKDKAGFLAAVAARAPHLRREGDRLVPRG